MKRGLLSVVCMFFCCDRDFSFGCGYDDILRTPRCARNWLICNPCSASPLAWGSKSVDFGMTPIHILLYMYASTFLYVTLYILAYLCLIVHVCIHKYSRSLMARRVAWYAPWLTSIPPSSLPVASRYTTRRRGIFA